jgi:formylglycine-generating enzyme required for sulfatase activity
MFYRVRATTNFAPAEMVLIPEGNFTMGNCMDTNEGSAYELPLHTVYVSAFHMDKYEVTKALWNDVYNWAITNGYSFENGAQGKGLSHPAQSMTWFDAVKWCNARSEKEGRTPAYYTSAAQTVVYRTGTNDLQESYVNWSSGYRLPTEAEWEKAARGGASGQRFSWGNTISWNQANYNASPTVFAYDANPTEGYHPTFATGGYPYTSPAGYFAPNGYGLYDMAGNVWEWCWDRYLYGAYSSGAQTDPHGPTSGWFRECRGGSWSNSALNARSAATADNYPTATDFNVGFRCVRAQQVSD